MTNMCFTAGILLLLVLPAGVSAQSLAASGPPLTFDVSSIKTTTRMQVPAPQVLPSGQFEMSGTTLRDLIRVAYPTRQGQVDVVGGPEWIRTARFDVMAKPAAGARPTVPMLQALLAERFKLKVRTEQRQASIWNLTLASKQGRLGPNLVPSTCGRMPDTSDARTAEEALTRLTAGPTLCTRMRIAAGPTLIGEASIPDLASLLSNYPVVDAPVVDRTGLSGVFSILMRWRGDNNPDPEAGPLLFTALEEQLGLKLERGTGTVDVVVIEAVEPLADN
jgi:uncharacterized protein (TIGR03435 family)